MIKCASPHLREQLPIKELLKNLSQSAVNTQQHGFGHSDCPVSTLLPGFGAPPNDYSGFILKYPSHRPLA